MPKKSAELVYMLRISKETHRGEWKPSISVKVIKQSLPCHAAETADNWSTQRLCQTIIIWMNTVSENSSPTSADEEAIILALLWQSPVIALPQNTELETGNRKHELTRTLKHKINQLHVNDGHWLELVSTLDSDLLGPHPPISQGYCTAHLMSKHYTEWNWSGGLLTLASLAHLVTETWPLS